MLKSIIGGGGGEGDTGEPAELEQQFILRMPEEPAGVLREALKNGLQNVRERLKLKMDVETRYGTLYFDDWVMYAKLVDLPCIIESHKTIDKKVVYKTADIAQMLICSFEEDLQEEDNTKKKSLKVDKKFIWPHGVTPPLKNVRKRRFRKVLKKKQYLDQPEIEKEVRRLFREDYEAHHIRWEVIDEEEDKTKEGGGKDVLMQGSKVNEKPAKVNLRDINAEELFGDALSDSEGEDDLDRLDDESRISMMDEDESSRLSDSQSMSLSQMDSSKDRESRKSGSGSGYPTSFSKDMFSSSSGRSSKSPEKKNKQNRRPSTSDINSMSREELQAQLSDLRQQLTEITMRRSIQETELSTTDNAALKNRLETALNKLANDQREKERDIRTVEMLLNQSNL